MSAANQQQRYSSKLESSCILSLLHELFDPVSLPPEVKGVAKDVAFTADHDLPYFPIPFKETETTAALKAVEGSVASLLARKRGRDDANKDRKVTVNMEKTTAFLFQAYLATVGGLGKLDKGVKNLLKGTDPLYEFHNFSLALS
jgi:hypothetical protein